MRYYIGLDTGGTFTDCVIMNEKGTITIGKASSTPDNPEIGFLEAIKVTSEGLNLSLEELLSQTAMIAVGTTLAVNTIINRTGAKTGLITTKGFEDTILIMRLIGRSSGLSREEMSHVVKINKPDPIVPRPLIKGVSERIDCKGQVICALNKHDVKRAVNSLMDSGVEAIAVSLLWSFVNPKHEQEIKQIIGEMCPSLFVTLSSEIAPMIGEYERTSSAVLNSYLGITMNKYLSSLVEKLKDKGYRFKLLVMQSYGGCIPAEESAKRALGTVQSGPVGGLIASRYLGEFLGYRNIIATDVGGTSFDVSLLSDGVMEWAHEPCIARYRSLIPMIEITSIGAAGGSICWLEPNAKLLKVGPHSAGAKPGPVCYDRGGTEPTVTDADLILGYLNPDYFLGGRMRLNKSEAAKAIRDKIATPLGMNVIEAAAGIYEIANAHMADLIRKVTIQRGHDPRNFILFAYGGNGPIHASIYGKELGVEKVVVPLTASVNSAMGVLSSDIMHTYHMSSPMVAPVDINMFSNNFDTLEKRAIDDLTREGFKSEDIAISRFVDMRFRRQTHEIPVPVPAKQLQPQDLEELYEAFSKIYEKWYGKGAAYREAGMEMINFKVEAVGKLIKPSLAKYKKRDLSPDQSLKIKREVYFGASENFVSTYIYDFDLLYPGNVIQGPAVIETPVTTIVIHPNQRATIDEYKNTIIEY